MKVLESKHPILVLSHHNCEIYCCHLDGYKSNTKALLNRMKKIEAEILIKPIQSQYKIWYNLDENRMDKSVMKAIAESIHSFQNHISKIAFIGLHGISKWKFDIILKQVIGEQDLPRAYFSDAELAKGWLV